MQEKREILSGSISLKSAEAIAIGAFDGMHRAHQELFKRLGDKGAIVVIDKEDALLTPGELRCKYTHYPCLFLKLQQIRHLDAAGFIALLKKHFPHLKKIVVGYDFAFGKNRKYKAQDLHNYFDGEVEIVDEVKIDGVSVHSRIIKEYIKKGEIAQVNRLLGRCYEIVGKRVAGQGIGSKELVPTMNLKVERFLLPQEGVYATYTRIAQKKYRSVTFIGHRYVTDGSFAVETYILEEFTEGSDEIGIMFAAFIRKNKKFDSLHELKKQIEDDIKKAQEILKDIQC